jgi:3-dehydroquinate synthase
MLAACRLSELVGLTDHTLTDRVRAALSRFELPTVLPDPLDPEDLLAFMRRDKKTRAGRLRFVLLEGIGRVVIDDNVTNEQIRDALSLLVA